MQYAVLLDFGSTYTKVACVDLEGRRVVMANRFASTVHTDARTGLGQCLEAAEAAIGKTALSEARKLASSSAAGGLRMAVVGLTRSLSIAAGRNAAFGAGAKIMANSYGWLEEEDVRALEGADVEIVLLCGGYERGNRDMILHNTEMLAGSRLNVPIIYAGNSEAGPVARELLRQGGKECFLVENIIPAVGKMNTAPAEEVIRHVFMKRIINMNGMGGVQEALGVALVPTPAAVLSAGELLSTGTAQQEGMGPLMLVDVGGATTDVYSFLKNRSHQNARITGAPEPYDKRTVEGDMGMRESSICILQETGAGTLAAKAGVSQEALEAAIQKRLADTSVLADSDEERRIDRALCREAVSISARRHAGRTELVYSKGARVLQRGKNLTEVETVVGTGGVLVNDCAPAELLQAAALAEGEDEHILIPRNLRTLIDHDYVFYAAGLLRPWDEEAALAIMKSSLNAN